MKQGFELLKNLYKGAKNRYDLLVGLVLGSMGVPHALDLFFVFNTNENKEGRFLKFGKTELQLADVFQDYWGKFAHTGSPNGFTANGRLVASPKLPEWKPFGEEGLVMRLQGSPTMEAVEKDVEEDIERRCSWWASNPSSLRARSKPWQLAPTSVNLGLRCCCDSNNQCVRVRSKESAKATQSAWYEADMVVKANWRGHCPSIDFGQGAVQTHHDPMGCVLDMPETPRGRCCCVESRVLPWFKATVEADAADAEKLVCKRISDTGDLNWRKRCDKICVDPPNPYEPCFQVQSHHEPDACDS